MGRWRWSVVAAALVVLAAACSSGEGATTTDRPGRSAGSTTTTLASFEPRTPAEPVSYPAQPDGVPWPTKAWPTGSLPFGVTRAEVDAQLDRDFGELSQGPNTTDELLRMASGLQWKEDYLAPDSDTVAMLYGDGKDDMAAYAASKPLAEPPDTSIYYSTGTSNILSRIVGRAVGTGGAYRRFIDRRLLRPLGIDIADAHLGWDGAGQLVGSSVFDLTARDFARFGLLFLRGGAWDGRQLLPSTWVDYSRTPTPPPHGCDKYAAHWWTYPDCPGGFRAGGIAGQHIVLCPTLDLEVVVLSNRSDQKDGQVRDDMVHLFRDAAIAQTTPTTTPARSTSRGH